ncbi:MAG: serine/threonine protein kinase [Myxococcales bacterium]|nr:serine/threonine protein kinase [Myxococcales bacterium]
MAQPDPLDVGLVGATLAGRYEILEGIGRGGMGEVYRAFDRELDEVVALKVVHAAVARLPGVVERFRAEVKLARRVTHKNVARTFELGLADGEVFLTMELVTGPSLAARLEHGPLPASDAIAVAVELCDALAAAHAVGVVHRDLKPDNVLLADDGRVVLTDFGVASLAASTDDTASGTPRYMAPEQARGEAPTAQVDVYALGLVLYEMLTGVPAFVGGLGTVLDAKQAPVARPAKLDELEPALAAIIARAIATDPAQRWAGVAALRAALAPDQPTARASAPRRPGTSPLGLPTVQVLPAEAPAELAPLVLGLHAELLRRLARRGHLRLMRGHARDLADGAWVNVVGVVGRGAVVTVRLPDRTDRLELTVALDVDALVAGAELASRLIAAAVGAGPERGADEVPIPTEARAHLWRAIERSRHDERDRLAAHDDFQAAARLAPDDTRIMAHLAMCEVRGAFFSEPPDPDQLNRATALATRAVALAPHLAEAHLAHGRVRLHHGDATAAAVHFRTAIACAPYLTDPHEWLGRMLLESGFLVEGLARMTDVLAMDPDLELPRWDLARAYALEGRWDEHDQLIGATRDPGMSSRLAVALRTAGWRNDRATIARIRDLTAQMPEMPMFERSLIFAVCDAVLADRWAAVRDQIVGVVTMGAAVGGARRRAFVGQIVCEVAAGSNDLDTAFAMLGLAVQHGLFDRHWLERCPLLDAVRADPRYPPLHARVSARAHAILDALYGDHAHRATADTLLVASATP